MLRSAYTRLLLWNVVHKQGYCLAVS